MKQTMSIFIFLSLLLACKSAKKISNSPAIAKDSNKNEACSLRAVVKDFSKERQGCGLMLVLDNSGAVLNPVILPENALALREGQKWNLSFVFLKGVRTTCGIESAQVRVTCLEEVLEQKNAPDKSTPLKKECVKTDNALDVPWMENLISKIKPQQVQRFPYITNGWAYYFRSNKTSLLYDCQGTLVCTGADCLKKVDDPNRGEVVYQKE